MSTLKIKHRSHPRAYPHDIFELCWFLPCPGTRLNLHLGKVNGKEHAMEVEVLDMLDEPAVHFHRVCTSRNYFCTTWHVAVHALLLMAKIVELYTGTFVAMYNLRPNIPSQNMQHSKSTDTSNPHVSGPNLLAININLANVTWETDTMKFGQFRAGNSHLRRAKKHSASWRQFTYDWCPAEWATFCVWSLQRMWRATEYQPKLGQGLIFLAFYYLLILG